MGHSISLLIALPLRVLLSMFCKEELEFSLCTLNSTPDLWLQKPKPELCSYILRDVKENPQKSKPETQNAQKQLPGIFSLFVCLMVVCA